MRIKSVQFDALEFEDINGQFRLIRGCSLAAREELSARFEQLSELLQEADQEITLIELYEQSKSFRHVCHCCLKLCNIALEWVDINMLTQLLINYEDKEGLLIQLNFPQAKRVAREASAATYPEVLAALWSHVGDLKKTIEAAETIPAQELIEMMEARSEQIKKASDPKYGENQMKQKWKEMARADIERMEGKVSANADS